MRLGDTNHASIDLTSVIAVERMKSGLRICFLGGIFREYLYDSKGVEDDDKTAIDFFISRKEKLFFA